MLGIVETKEMLKMKTCGQNNFRKAISALLPLFSILALAFVSNALYAQEKAVPVIDRARNNLNVAVSSASQIKESNNDIENNKSMNERQKSSADTDKLSLGQWLLGIISALTAAVYKRKWILGGLWKIVGLFSKKGKQAHASNNESNVSNMGNGNNIAGNGNVVTTNITINNNIEQHTSSDSDESKSDEQSCFSECATTNKGISDENMDELEIAKLKKKFKPFRRRIFPTLLSDRMHDELLTVDKLNCSCSKDRIKICVIDDKNAEETKEGLAKLGYMDVECCGRCPSLEELKVFAIVIFDIRGVGNEAGKNGLILAKEFKRSNPTRFVIVRSAYLKDADTQDGIDFLFEKKRSLSEQIGPVLSGSYVGNPNLLWGMVRDELLRAMSFCEMAILEHKYVCAVRLLADVKRGLPGNWMTMVNELLDKRVF